MKNKVLFLSSILSEKTYFENSKGQTSTANDSFQRSVVQGFEQNGFFIEMFNVPNIGAFPNRYKKPVIKKTIFKLSENAVGKSIGFLNLPLIKHWFLYLNLFFVFRKIEVENYKYVVCYDLYSPFLKILLRLKKKNKSIKVIIIIPDLPEYAGMKSSIISKQFVKRKTKLQNKVFPYIDRFALVSEAMADKLGIVSEKTVLMEGIWNDKNQLKEIENKDTHKKYIFYGGVLAERHGLLNLIDAFILASFKNVDLVLCGDGDLRNKVLDYSHSYDNIIYKGQVTKDEVLELQANASLLVNPRGSKEEFTKYSFPSKIIEYFASGTPTFMYVLEGIPKEFYNYCYYSDDESIDELKNKLIEIINLPSQELYNKSIKARNFILKNKTPKLQVFKMINGL